MLARIFSSNICTSFIVLLHCRNRDLFVNFFLREIDNCFCSRAIQRRNKCFDEVKKKVAKA